MTSQVTASRGTQASTKVPSEKQDSGRHQSRPEPLTFHDHWKPDGSANHPYTGYTSRARFDGKR